MAEERSTGERFSTDPGAAETGPGERPYGGAAEESRRYAEETAEAARATAREAGQSIQQYGEQMRHQGYEMVWQQQEAMAGWLERVGDAFGQSAEQLRRSNDTTVAACMESTSDRARGAASYLRDHEPREVMDDAAGFAREHPAWVIGGALLTGFAVSRFIKAAWSPDEQSREQQQQSAQGYSEEMYSEPAEPSGVQPSPPEPSEPTARPGTAVPPPQP